MTHGAARPCPYVGLRPFDRTDSLYFFGRRAQVSELLQQLHKTRFLAVVGSSGCGKSSLIRAGLIPALLGGFLVQDRDRWLVAKMKPGGGPIANLAQGVCALEGHQPKPEEVRELERQIVEGHTEGFLDFVRPQLASDGNLLLLLDQFEEIFAFRGDAEDESLAETDRSKRLELLRRQEEAADFVDLILAVAEQTEVPVYVVLTMRSDFLGDCDLFYGLPEAMNLSRYLVPRLNRGQLREAIEGPALLAGASLAPRLVDALLNELGDRTDQLPILQHALMRSWDVWQSQGGNGAIDVEHYEAAGTLRNALPRHADEALRDEDLAATSRMFKCLTDRDPNHRRVRRAASVGELSAVADAPVALVEGILKRFNEDGRNFLLISPTSDADDAKVEITHESLIRQWDQLARWVDEEGEARDQFRELVDRARGGRALLQDPDLQIALNWETTVQPTKAWARRYNRDPGDFGAALEYLERSRLAQVEARNRRRRNRNLALAATVAVVLALASLAVWALDNAARAQDTARVAIAGDWIEKDPTAAALILLDVRHPERTRLAAPKMRDLLDHPIASQVLRGHEGPVEALVFSADGKRIASASQDGTARVWMADGSGPPVVLRGHEGAVWALAFSPDGARLATGSEDWTVRVWNTDGSGSPVVQHGHEGRVVAVAFSPDGSRIASASEDGTARVWSADGMGEPMVFYDHQGMVMTVVFSPDGNRIVSASEDGTARVWNADGSGVPVVLLGHEGSLATAVFSPDGARVVTGADDGTARVWNANGSGDPFVFKGGSGLTAGTESVAFSPDGQRVVTIYTGFDDQMVHVWNAEGSGEAVELPHEGNDVSAASVFPINAGFTADGTRILTSSSDGTARLWNADGSGQPLILRGHVGRVVSAASPVDTRFATASSDGTVRVWTTAPPGEPAVLSGHADWVGTAAFSPDGSRIVTGSDDSSVRVWSTDGSGLPVVLEGHEDAVTTVSFSPDGVRIASGSNDGTARVWNADGTGEPVVFEDHEGRVVAAAFSPEGGRIVTASEDETARVWSTGGYGELVVLEGHDGPVTAVAFSPDGRLIASGSDDESVRVWNADGSGEPVVLSGHEGQVGMVSFSPDGARIVSASGDETARIWNADGAGKPVVLRHDGWVGSAVFSADGTRIVTASDDGRARVWNADGSGEPVVLAGHVGQVGTASFSPDGARVVTGAVDGTARVWRSDGLGEPLVLRGHGGRLTTASFNPDGTRVLTASTDGTARIWSFTADRLQDAIAAVTKACLDAAFRESYLNESAGQARGGFEDCERRHGRTP